LFFRAQVNPYEPTRNPFGNMRSMLGIVYMNGLAALIDYQA
jgi:hypothetical protein